MSAPGHPKLRCRTDDGTEWAVETHRRVTPGPNGEIDRSIVVRSDDGGASWNPVSMRLSLGSRVWNGLFATWPPEKVDELASAGPTSIVVTFRDEWIPFERPILPFGLDQESLWQAQYYPLRQHWRLLRIRTLDYEGSDKPGAIPKG